MNKEIKRNKGITLIALIITIIVLLILAGVTIAQLEDGIIEHAKLARNKTEKAIETEKDYLEELEYGMIDENDNKPVPEGKYYSIRKGKEKTYYATLKEAYDASVDNGKKYEGGTIVLEKDVTEDLTESIIMNKTITIDLKQNTMTRNQGIYLTGGTLTITGENSSAMIGSGDDMILLTVANDANITILGSPLIESTSHPILTCRANYHPVDLSSDDTLLQSSGTVNIQGGYIVSTERSGMGIKGTGKIFINNTTVLGIRNDKNALSITEDSTSDIVVDGNSILANGMVNAGGIGPTCSMSGSGNLTIRGNTIVTAGLYGSNALLLKKPITINIEDNASLYSQNGRTVLVKANEATLNINTRGIICGKGTNVPIGINDGVDDVNCNILSGIFASGSTKPLQQVEAYMTNYPQEEIQQNVEYYYFDSEDFKTLKTLTAPNLYVVKIGVN